MSEANKRQVGGQHYATEAGVQHWDLFGPDYLIGYATKYMRWRKKGGVEDLEKAIHVVEKLKEIVTEHNMPKYDPVRVLEWQKAVGLDFVERTIVNRIMFRGGRRDLDVAIEGIRYLIAGASDSSKETLALSINYTKLDEHETHDLYAELARLTRANAEAPGWGAAVGARDESIRDIQRALERRKPRVPRLGTDGGLIPRVSPELDTPSCGDGLFDTHQRARAERLHQVHVDASHPRADDAAQHASLFPWCMSKDRWQATFAGRIEIAKHFYVTRGVENKMLDVSVSHGNLPRELAPCYNLHNASIVMWVIRIESVPAELRDDYPYLERELNKTEMDSKPFWQTVLYRWDEKTAKHVLTVDAWARN